jgi:hypothetical protein
MSTYIGESMHCSSCSKHIYAENDLKRTLCFSCHVKGISFGFRGAEDGQSSWNNSTIKEVQQSYEPLVRAGKVEKLSVRKELI